MFTTVTAKHILIKTEDRTEEEAKKLADKIKKELSSADKFDEIMLKYSEDPASKDESEGMTFGRGQMVKEFEDAAFSQEIGIVGEPIKTQYGYHIVLVMDKEVKDLDEMRFYCETELFNSWFEAQLQTWKNEANISVDEAAFSKMVNK